MGKTQNPLRDIPCSPMDGGGLKVVCRNFFKTLSFLGLLFCLSPQVAIADTPAVNDVKEVLQSKKKFTGKVVGEGGETLPGATVMVVGSTRGVTTDLDGSFTIEVAENEKLEIGYLGMESQIIEVKGKNHQVITLKNKQSELEEVTVVAFAKQKKESVIASVTTINPSELKVPSSNLTTALAGRMSGVIAYQRSGEPGQDNADFFVRGVTTFGTGKANPLILIDGIELSSNDLARLNPDDIASFSIMKDANATALYGARGANGVILVTTKEGTEGKVKLSMRFENSFSTAADEVELADPITYMKLHNEAVATRDPKAILPYSNEKIANTARGLNPYAYPAVDWQNMLFKDFTSNQRFNLSLSGGGKVARYYVAANVNIDNGILKVDKRNNFNNNIKLKKYLLRSNINLNLTKSTEMVVRLHGTFDDYTGPIPGGVGLYNMVMKTSPVLYPAYFQPDEATKYHKHILFGNYDEAANYFNPYAEMVKGYKDYSTTLVLGQVELHQKLDFITKGLNARILFNTTRYSHFDLARNYNPFYYSVGAYDKVNNSYLLTALNPEAGTEYLNYNEGGKQVESSTYFEAAVQYNNTFADVHTVSGLLVYTAREKLNGNAGSLTNSLPFRNLGLAGRFTYAYDSRYFAEFNFGYNGSERFAKNERFGFFPSFGVGYLISNEKFFEPISNVVTKLKLKATYGVVGNDQIGDTNDRFFYLSNVNMSNGSHGNFGTDMNYSKPGISISRYEDPFITWERSYKQNYGIELGLFNKLDLQIDYFRENRKNILQERADIPSTMGLQSTPRANIGEAFGTGFEVQMDYNQSFNKDFWISARGNFTYATSEFKVYEEPSYTNTPWLRRAGRKISQQMGFIAERLFVDEEDVKNSPKQNFGEYGAGDIKYKDINMDGQINNHDMVAIGYPQTPEIIYGAGVSVGYKNFDISMFWQGSARSSFWISPSAISPFIDTDSGDGHVGRNALMQEIANSHWSEDNRNIHAFWPRLSDKSIANNLQTSTWWMRDGTFLRLKNVEVGYTVPEKWTKKAHMSLVRLYLSGSNLLCFSNFKLWDPEMAGNGLGYPVQRVFNLGINVSF